MMGITYFKVGVMRTPAGGTHIATLLDGQDWTLDTRISVITALRLGQELIRAAKSIGLPAGTVDLETP